MTAQTEVVNLLGADFHIAEKVGLMPVMRFATVAQSGVDANEMEALAAMHELLRQCIHPEEWGRFQKHATDVAADGDQLMECVSAVMVIVGARPTGRSSDSSGGPRIIEPSSEVVSSSPATDRVVEKFNANGRPDLALLVRKREESLTG